MALHPVVGRFNLTLEKDRIDGTLRRDPISETGLIRLLIHGPQRAEF